MKNLFVPYYIALILKLKGFNEECLMCFYGDNNFGQPEDKLFLPPEFGKLKNSQVKEPFYVAAPLYQQVEDWLLTKGVYAKVSLNQIYNDKYGYNFGRLTSLSEGFTIDTESCGRYKSLDKAILGALELIPDKKQKK